METSELRNGHQLTRFHPCSMRPCQLIIVSTVRSPYSYNSCIAWVRIVSSYRTGKLASDSYLAQSDDAGFFK
jgi:hypothetical protein